MKNFPGEAPSRGLNDVGRRLDQMMRHGTICEVDHAKARYRVKSGDQVTGWLPMVTGRAGGQCRTWSPPVVGEQVTVLAPSGDTAQGFILPGSIYQDAHPAPAASEDLDLAVHADGARFSYDRAAHVYTIDIPAGGEIIIRIGASEIRMTAEGVKIRGDRLDLNDDR